MICNWVKGRYHPLGRCNRMVEGPGLAYVIGGWLGDGSLARDRSGYKHWVRLEVSDYDFAEEWGRRLAEALGRSKPYTPRWDDDLQRWVVKGSSILLYSLLKRAKDDPWILIPYLEKKYPAEACRGFFDAEGYVEADYYRIVADNTDSNIIDLFGLLFEKLDINYKIYRCHQNETFLDLILRFAEKVGFTITRKQVELMKLVRRYRKSRRP